MSALGSVEAGVLRVLATEGATTEGSFNGFLGLEAAQIAAMVYSVKSVRQAQYRAVLRALRRWERRGVVSRHAPPFDGMPTHWTVPRDHERRVTEWCSVGNATKVTRKCHSCDGPVSARARFCSSACKQRAYRERQR